MMDFTPQLVSNPGNRKKEFEKKKKILADSSNRNANVILL